MSVGVKAGTTPFEAPRPLFETRLPSPSNLNRNTYVVSGDGQRFLVNTAVGEARSAPITIVMNWATGLRK